MAVLEGEEQGVQDLGGHVDDQVQDDPIQVDFFRWVEEVYVFRVVFVWRYFLYVKCVLICSNRDFIELGLNVEKPSGEPEVVEPVHPFREEYNPRGIIVSMEFVVPEVVQKNG